MDVGVRQRWCILLCFFASYNRPSRCTSLLERLFICNYSASSQRKGSWSD